MKKNLFVIVMLNILTILLMVGVVRAYTPSPGVLEPEEVDLEGETVIYVDGHDRFDPENAPELVARKEEAEKLFNVNIETEIIDTGNLTEELMTRLMAGEADYDIWRVSRTDHWKLASEEALYPVGEILPSEYYQSLPSFNQKLHESLKYRGEYIVFGSLTELAFYFLAWNKSLFEREGLPNIYKLYDEGNWDWEQLTEIALAATRDTTGDGEVDQWGMSGALRHRWEHPRWATANEAKLLEYDDGEYVFAYDNDNALNALRQVRDWWDMGVFGPLASGNSKFRSGNVAISFVRGILMNDYAEDLAEEGDDMGIIPYPKGPDAKKYHVSIGEYHHAFGLPISSEKPEELIALNEYIWRPEKEKNIELIMEMSPDQKSFEIFKSYYENYDAFDLPFLWFLIDDVIFDPINEVYGDQKSATSAMESVRPVAKSILDDFFAQ